MQDQSFPRTLIVGLLLLIGAELAACSCGEFTFSFCEYSRQATSVVSVRVLNLRSIPSNDNPDWSIPVAEVAVMDRFYLLQPVPDTFSLLGQDGLNCNDMIQFAVGDSLIVALDTNSYTNTTYAPSRFPGLRYRVYDYGICASVQVRLRGNQVQGAGLNMSLADFVRELPVCLQTVSVDDPASRLPDWDIAPNPARAYAQLRWWSAPTDARLHLYSADGRLLLQQSVWLNDALPLPLPTDHLPTGVYAIVLHIGDQSYTRRLVVH